MHELVSVITPAYNAAAYLPETIESVMAQTYKNWELLIIDDCSRDNTLALANTYKAKEERIRVVASPKNGGAPYARNLGVETARGRLIAFLDSDDTWKPEKLERQLEAILATGAVFSFTSYNVLSGSKKLRTVAAPPYVDYKTLLKGCNIGCSTVMYDTHELGKQYFNLSSPPAREDYVLWLKIAGEFGQKGTMQGIPEPLTNYRKHGGGISSSKMKAACNQWKVYRNIESIGLFPSVYYFMCYAMNGFSKHYS